MTAMTIFLLLAGLGMLLGGAEFLVRGASRLATAAGISPLIVGLTVVAFGTSAPELAVSVMSAFKGQANLALGNVVGSNIFNVLVILGLSAVVVPLLVAQQLVRFDVPVMIVVSALLFLLGRDGLIGRADGLVLAAGAIAYTLFLIRLGRRETNEEIRAEYEGKVSGKEESGRWWLNALWVVSGIAALVAGSKLLVTGGVAIAQAFGVSELVIGLTVIAAGTSLPEVAASLVAAFKGERDIAVGNVVGSNIFNILCVLGFSSVVSPRGIDVSHAALEFDIPVMIAVAVACLPVFFAGYRISRMNGLAFLAFYGFYLTYLIFTATQHEALGTYRAAMLYFVLPITILTLVVITTRALARKNLAA